MEEQTPEMNENADQKEAKNQGQGSTLIIVLAAALILAIAGIVFLLVVYVLGGDSGSESEGGIVEPPPPGVTVEATVIPPTPEPGNPTATVIARAGVNVRTGPGIEYPVLGIAPQGTILKIVGVSQDGTWWVIAIPGAPNNYGWVSEEYVAVQNADNILVVPAPPTPTPAATATPTATPAPAITFTANRTTINAGEKATLSWSVENVSAVFMYPVGDRFENYPTTGQGSRDVQPYITTSYELLTFNPDGTTSSSRIEITVVSGLTGGRWILNSYSTPGGGLQRLIPGTEITARFAADGSLSGSAGCNNYTGSFMAYDQVLRIFSLTSSQAFCESPRGIMEQEGTFLSLMQQASRMSISAGQFSVFDASGNRILEFISG